MTMKYINLFLTVAFAFFNISLLGETRTWTSTAGSKLTAQLMDYSNRVVTLRSSDGKKITLPINKLVSEDQLFVTKWANDKQAVKNASKSAYSRNTVEKKSAKLSSGMAELLPSKILNSKGKSVSSSELAGKVVGFYFSAHWCPPCRAFTPSLVDFRDQNNDDFEVVFVSSDRNPDAQMSYMKEANMKWYTLEHRSQDANKLSQKFGIRGIPALIIVSPDGETITTNGRGEVSSNPSQAIKKWKQSS
jgi:nucleoredoxin